MKKEVFDDREVTYYKFSDPEIEYLLSLLADYAEKLRLRSEAWYRQRFKTEMVGGSIVVFLIIVGLSSLLGFQRNWLDLQVALLVLASLLLIIVSFGLVHSHRSEQSKLESDNIARFRIVMERLVRRASQLEAHGAVNFTLKIALDLRLSEAEAALRYSEAAARRSEYYEP
jgi:hypothetical protein